MSRGYPRNRRQGTVAWFVCSLGDAWGRLPSAHTAAGRGMQQPVLDWLDEFESGAECSHRLEAVSNAVQQDPAALATLVREGGLAHLVALAKESASGSVATILVVASEEYAQELVEANALTVIVGLVNTEENQEDAAWALGNLSAHADIADAMITCGALRTAASPCGPGAAGARPGIGCAGCWWRLCCGMLSPLSPRIAQPRARTRSGACMSVLTEPQTHLSRCFVASTLVPLSPTALRSHVLTCAPSLPHPHPQPPTYLHCLHLAPPQPAPPRSLSQANLAVDVRGKPAIGELGGVEALLQVPQHGATGGRSGQSLAPLAPLDCQAHGLRTLRCAVQRAVHHHGRCCRMPTWTRWHRSRVLANLLLDDACQVRSSRIGSRLRLLLQQARHRWVAVGGEGGVGVGGGRGAHEPHPTPNPCLSLRLSLTSSRLLTQVASTDEAVQESAVRPCPRPNLCPPLELRQLAVEHGAAFASSPPTPPLPYPPRPLPTAATLPGPCDASRHTVTLEQSRHC